MSCESCQSKLCEDCMKIIEECDNYDGRYNHKQKKCACCAGEVLSANDIDNVKRLHDQKLCVECLYDAQHKPYRNSHNNELEPEMKNIRKELNEKLPKLLKSSYWITKCVDNIIKNNELESSDELYDSGLESDDGKDVKKKDNCE